MNPPEPSVGTIDPSVLPFQPDQYHDAYELRRASSSMATVARDWLCAWAQNAVRHRGEGSPLRILSVGCGDGNLDLPLLRALHATHPVDYTGVDVNATSLDVFRAELQGLAATLVQSPIEQLGLEGEPFDLVIVSHMLYYVAEPSALVARLLQEFTRTDGHLVVIHSAHDGIPALMASVDGLTPFLTAEDVADGLAALGLEPTWHRLHTELDATDLLADTPQGRAVLEFCIETPLTALAPGALDQLHAELSARSTTRGGRAYLTEAVGALVLRNHLRLTPVPTAGPKHDPLEDYHRLAEAFAWPERLLTLPRSADGEAHLLDVGCGTGRWLRVLGSTFPELAAGQAHAVRYSMLDPVRPAIETAAEVASDLFSIGRSWNDYIQKADLPSDTFGLIWAVHSLYGVPRSDLPGALEHMLRALHPQGTAVIVLPDASSFYVDAAVQLLGHTVFTSAEDVRAELEAMGCRYHVRHVRYDECIPASDDAALRHYVWMESIGNTYLPGGAHDDLPAVPTGEWWDSHRQGDVFAFRQNVEVITIAGGQ